MNHKYIQRFFLRASLKVVRNQKKNFMYAIKIVKKFLKKNEKLPYISELFRLVFCLSFLSWDPVHACLFFVFQNTVKKKRNPLVTNHFNSTIRKGLFQFLHFLNSVSLSMTFWTVSAGWKRRLWLSNTNSGHPPSFRNKTMSKTIRVVIKRVLKFKNRFDKYI